MSPLNKSPFIPEALSDLIESFRLLPSIGPKTAQRLAFATLKMPADQIKSIASALSEIREKIKHFGDILKNDTGKTPDYTYLRNIYQIPLPQVGWKKEKSFMIREKQLKIGIIKRR